jgi:hypothetical protein
MICVVGLLQRLYSFLILTFASYYVALVHALDVNDAIESQVVRRPNFDVVFRYQQQIFTYSENYIHHLILDLPLRNQTATETFRRMGETSKDIIRDQATKSLANITFSQAIRKAVFQEALNLQKSIDHIYDLFPQINQSAQGDRKQRSYCLIYCSGLAWETDVDALRQLIRESNNITAQNFRLIQKSLAAMASYSRVTDQKIDALKYILQHQSHNSDILTRTLRDAEAGILAMLNSFLPNADQLLTLQTSLILLKHNILTFNILPYSQARVLLSEIKQHVEESPFTFLTDPDPLNLYKDSDIYYFRTGEQLHIGLRIKLSPFRQPLSLFKVEKFELDIPGQDHASILGDLPLYIAISDADDMYLTITERPSLQKDKFYFLGLDQHTIVPKHTLTCVMALFQDDLINTAKLCATFLRPFSKKPRMRHLGASLLLLHNIDSYQVADSYNNTWTETTNCTVCIKTIPCGAKVQS